MLIGVTQNKTSEHNDASEKLLYLMLGSCCLFFRFVKLYSERIPKILSCNSAFLLSSVILNCILVVVITNKASQKIHCEISFSMINALPVYSVPPLITSPVVTLCSPSSLLCFLVALPLWSLHPTLDISSNNIQCTKHWCEDKGNEITFITASFLCGLQTRTKIFLLLNMRFIPLLEPSNTDLKSSDDISHLLNLSLWIEENKLYFSETGKGRTSLQQWWTLIKQTLVSNFPAFALSLSKAKTSSFVK